MKLRQEEYCHYCNSYVIFEFDDDIYKQIIYCPNCGHEHYRELDEGILTNIRLYGGRQQRSIRFAKPITLNPGFIQNSDNCPVNMSIEYEEKKIIGSTPDGNIIIENNGETNFGEKTKVVSNRRWSSNNG